MASADDIKERVSEIEDTELPEGLAEEFERLAQRFPYSTHILFAFELFLQSVDDVAGAALVKRFRGKFVVHEAETM